MDAWMNGRVAGSERRFWRGVRALSEEGFARSGERVHLFGFDFDHAGVTVRAGDREGLERWCRYGARPE